MSVPVATRNPFAVLDENPSPPSTPPPPPQEAAPVSVPQSQPTRGRGRGGPASRGGRYYARGGAAASSTPATEDQPVPEGKQPRRTEGERKEGRGRGRGAGGPRGRGRPFDRHSATGKTDSDKKVQNSWGGHDGETERKAEEAATIDAAVENADATGLNEWATPSSADADADAWGAAPAAEDTPTADGAEKNQAGDRRERRGDKEEEEDNTLTLDQYLAQQREKENALVPKLEVRKPNEGEDDLFKDAAPLKKDDELEYFAGKTKSAPKARPQKEAKVFIEIEARFERPNRGGRGGRGGDRGDRGRGERGRGRGGGGRGRGRGAAANGTATVNVDDESAFPSLS